MTTANDHNETPALRPSAVMHTWWPLAASWLLMGIEGPMVAAAISRIREPEIQLAALGGVVFPLALVVESPIIMMLSASTALSRDDASFRRLRAFMTRIAFGLTALHALIAFTPLFDLIAVRAIGAPPQIIEPSRTGFQLMTLWTWAIADRRFHQGLLIRFGLQRQIGVGTIVRLIGTAAPLVVGLVVQTIPGIVMAGCAFTAGVFAEAAYARWCAAKVIRGPLREAPAVEPLSTRRLWAFYVPLAMTPLISLLAQPIGSAGMTRMPEALASLAIWPVLSGFVFLLRSTGMAYNETVIRHVHEGGATRLLPRMAYVLGGGTTALMVLIAATPLSRWWFADLSGLEPELAALARDALWWAALMPLLTFVVAYDQGLLVAAHRTRGITEAVVVFLVTTSVSLAVCVALEPLPGASAALLSLTIGALSQCVWLRIRARAVTAGGGDVTMSA